MTTVKEVMSKNVKTVGPSATVAEAAEAMKKNRVGGLVIVEGNKPVGIITERDIVYKIVVERKSVDTKVEEIMSKDLRTITEDRKIDDAAKIMAAHLIRRLPVVDEEGGLIGIIAMKDIMKAEKVRSEAGYYPYFT
ncbi:MAG: CBS domain-containing protein [Candidatus Hydrothermarchaeales archaeon]